MKNKKLLYVLIPLAALIWGMIMRQVFSYKQGSEQNITLTVSSPESEIRDTTRYVVEGGYRDPFLRSGQLTTSNTPATKQNKIRAIKVNEANSLVTPSGIVYRGVISGISVKIGLLEYNKQKMLVKEKESLGDYQVVHVGEDSLRIIYHDKIYAYCKE